MTCFPRVHRDGRRSIVAAWPEKCWVRMKTGSFGVMAQRSGSPGMFAPGSAATKWAELWLPRKMWRLVWRQSTHCMKGRNGPIRSSDWPTSAFLIMTTAPGRCTGLRSWERFTESDPMIRLLWKGICSYSIRKTAIQPFRPSSRLKIPPVTTSSR